MVLKSDAYGHGHSGIAAALEKSTRLFGFGVANVEEGIELRRDKVRSPILVMSGIQHMDEDIFRCLETCTLTPVLSSLKVLQQACALTAKLKRPLSVHLKFNTGMNRLGIDLNEVEDAIRAVKGSRFLRVDGLMSHYAASEKPVSPLTKKQTKNFRHVVERFRANGVSVEKIHLANSSGIRNKTFPEGNVIRVGLHLYGIGGAKLEAVARWTAQVYQVREIAKGDSVGYGPLFTAKKKMRTAVLGVGYADGYRRALSNRADVLIHGKRCRVIGAVSMDLTAVDVTHVPGVSESSRAVLLGEDGREKVTVEELAKLSGCIPWEMLTGISPRVPRRYVDE